MKLLTPAEYVIRTFGGIRKTARAIGRAPSTVHAWNLPADRKGMNGGVPRKAQPLVLKAAGDRDLDITPDDLVLGRLVPDLKA